MPPTVKLAAKQLIMPWEELRTAAYLDTLPKRPVWTVCYGEALAVKKGMKFTPDAGRLEAKLIQRVIYDYRWSTALMAMSTPRYRCRRP
ncbi:lysozyme [Mesorhizobium sp. M2D.F.Ca.ET.233.01.1.1]|uniref:lysozyme n=1 Tax=Mesorhizobium sp. M2D.F.Ca.ET.233.01.1.1 TaxID=2563943 RepID=UPI00109359D8|nr:lysozyme [Mesorhizobium sp. M2D.F.Ca.ET.233.01.1.1]TGP14678.1 hypothetical protein EN876_26030 [Mesorhizobium sp. M2D.F.Ca.ET.233.01.1.1]TGV66877.1 hypothetical protein EN803_25520 [Mesorhizobium sp. M2D.F.Ca.ET.160.01.1.1]